LIRSATRCSAFCFKRWPAGVLANAAAAVATTPNAVETALALFDRDDFVEPRADDFADAEVRDLRLADRERDRAEVARLRLVGAFPRARLVAVFLRLPLALPEVVRFAVVRLVRVLVRLAIADSPIGEVLQFQMERTQQKPRSRSCAANCELCLNHSWRQLTRRWRSAAYLSERA
jgi:hypothetical protein